MTQLSVLPGTPPNSAGPFVNADPETLPPLHPPTPTPISLPSPPNLSSSGTSIFKSSLFQAVQTSHCRKTVRAPKMVRKGRDKQGKQHEPLSIERRRKRKKGTMKQNSRPKEQIVFIYRFLGLTKAFRCVRRAAEGQAVVPEQKLHMVITEGKSRKVLLLGWG